VDEQDGQPQSGHNESSLRLPSSACQGFFEGGFDGEGVAALLPGRIVVPRSGSGLSEEPAFGV
jgi:hypothetical protein